MRNKKPKILGILRGGNRFENARGNVNRFGHLLREPTKMGHPPNRSYQTHHESEREPLQKRLVPRDKGQTSTSST